MMLLPLLILAGGWFLGFGPLPSGVHGVACDSAQFAHVEGNAQHLCPDGFRGIYLDEKVTDAASLRVLVCHERFHLDHGATAGQTTWERFREAEAYAAGEKCR